MSPSTPRSWVVRPRPTPGAALRLFCFPHAGVGASTYRAWATELGASIEVCAVQPPGRESRMMETPFRDAGALVAALVPALLPFLDRPFVFFGHSLGSLIAFESCRALRRQGGPLPARLLVSGRRAPHLRVRDKALHAMPQEELIAELRSYNGTPDDLLANTELMDLMLPVIRADFAIHETYAHLAEAPLPMPIAAFGGIDDPNVAREHLAAWEEHTTSTFSRCMFPGDHFYHLRDRAPLIAQVGAAVAPLLARI